jgi:hypothetical protein
MLADHGKCGVNGCAISAVGVKLTGNPPGRELSALCDNAVDRAAAMNNNTHSVAVFPTGWPVCWIFECLRHLSITSL